MAEGPHDRIKRYLAETHALEVGQVTSLKGMAADCKDIDPDAFQLFTEHLAMTERQRDRLEARLKELDASPSGGKSLLSKLGAFGADMASNLRDNRDQVANHLFAAYAAENLEMATYSALEAAAQTIGDEPTARLAHDIFLEEKMTAEKIFPHIARFSRQTMLDAGAMNPEEQEENETKYASKGYIASA